MLSSLIKQEFYCNLDIRCVFMLVVSSVYQMLPTGLNFLLVLVLIKAKITFTRPWLWSDGECACEDTPTFKLVGGINDIVNV